MKKADVEIGKVYLVKLNGKMVPVRIKQTLPYGGWEAVNLFTEKRIRIGGAQRLVVKVSNYPTYPTESPTEEPCCRREGDKVEVQTLVISKMGCVYLVRRWDPEKDSWVEIQPSRTYRVGDKIVRYGWIEKGQRLLAWALSREEKEYIVEEGGRVRRITEGDDRD